MKYFKFFLLLLCLSNCTLIFSQKKTHKIVFQFTNANDTLQQKAFTNQLNNILTHWPKGKDRSCEL
jgi:uncharacterized protein